MRVDLRTARVGLGDVTAPLLNCDDTCPWGEDNQGVKLNTIFVCVLEVPLGGFDLLKMKLPGQVVLK